MMADVLLAIVAIFAIVLTLSGIGWLVGSVWNKAAWIRDGRPVLNPDEQLFADLLVARGYTVTLARRSVIAMREAPSQPTASAIPSEMIDRLKDDLSDAKLGPWLRESPLHFAQYMLAKPDDDPLKQDYMRRYLTK